MNKIFHWIVLAVIILGLLLSLLYSRLGQSGDAPVPADNSVSAPVKPAPPVAQPPLPVTPGTPADGEKLAAAGGKPSPAAVERGFAFETGEETPATAENPAPASPGTTPLTAAAHDEKAPAAAPAAPAAPAESPLPAQAPARPKLTRPGTRLETGSAMPCTEFDRPDPLAGDRIMDATARLLAPRRLTLSPVSSREEHGRPRKRSAGQAAQPRQKSEGQKGRSAHTAPQAESRKPAPSKHKKSSQGRGQDRRRSFQDPPRPTGHPKDSTEQESLMKPYYLDI